MHHAIILIAAWSGGHPSCRLMQLFAHTVLNVVPRLLGLVLSRAWICLHFERINVRLNTGREFGTIISEDSVLVLSWTWLLNFLCLETVIFWHGPVRSLYLILCRRLELAWPWHVTQALVVYKLGDCKAIKEEMSFFAVTNLVGIQIYLRLVALPML